MVENKTTTRSKTSCANFMPGAPTERSTSRALLFFRCLQKFDLNLKLFYPKGNSGSDKTSPITIPPRPKRVRILSIQSA